MGTILNPDISIQFYDGTNWIELISEAIEFSVRDGGLRKSPLAIVNLLEPSSLPSYYDLFRINVDIRGVQDQIFYGRIFEIEQIAIPGTTRRRAIITALGLEGAVLNRRFITKNYQDEQDALYPNTRWTFEGMIVNFLETPDSGYAVWDLPAGEFPTYRLDTDSGVITNAIYGNNNFKHESLLDAIRRIGEFLGYDGYVYIDPTTDKARVKFVALGTLAASPVVTFEEPFLAFRKRGHIRDVRNYILVKGGADVGVPFDEDRFTEYAVSKWNATYPAWSAIDPNTSLSDSTSKQKKNAYSVLLSKTTEGSEYLSARLNLANAGFSNLDFEVRVRGTAFYVYPEPISPYPGTGCGIKLSLVDNLDNKISVVHNQICEWDRWNLIKIPTAKRIISKDEAVVGSYYYDVGSSFDLTNVTDVEFYFFQYSKTVSPPPKVDSGDEYERFPLWLSIFTGSVYIDSLLFYGGKEIIPDSLNPPVQDATSQSNYGVSTHWLFDQDINSFEMAQYEGQRILNVLKDPVEIVNLTMRSVTWTRPTQTVTLNIPRFGITNETWRIMNVNYRYSPATRIVCGFDLVKQTQISPPPWSPRRGEVPRVPSEDEPPISDWEARRRYFR